LDDARRDFVSTDDIPETAPAQWSRSWYPTVGERGTMPSMLRTEIDAVLVEVLRDRRLLAHPFYRRWEAGTLERAELGAYAAQYRHFEAALPGVLENVLSRIGDPTARRLVQANLDDERGVPAPHLDLFEEFAQAVGAPAGSEATTATAALVGLYESVAEGSPVAALAALAAYEVQASEIAVSKADGLRARYGVPAAGTRFWDVHGDADEAHGDWMVEALGALAVDSDEVRRAADAAASAWWAFLDEREAARPAALAC
jgi:pyrroloquinoline-quinone synthase